MLSFTEKAVQKVQEVIGSQPDAEGFRGIRVSVVGGGCSGFQYAMNLERESRENDQVIQVDGFQVFVDEQSMIYLDGTEIDYIETVQGAGFKFNNPNVSGTCGCGESFHV
ncbi:MAG TPA: iron-sulfur cluster assembly accessory protein [Acidobacteriota bacterium]|nr:iron-sulfur cluster assembly accessory protein [Acidobacteriota bacterium]